MDPDVDEFQNSMFSLVHRYLSGEICLFKMTALRCQVGAEEILERVK